jgi:hypothetical protein
MFPGPSLWAVDLVDDDETILVPSVVLPLFVGAVLDDKNDIANVLPDSSDSAGKGFSGSTTIAGIGFEWFCFVCDS